MSVAPGTRLDRYEIISLLGVGGMGEVYLALDTRLDRRVALKLLPAQYTRDAGRVRRFVQEAKAASALNHPNIITIHEIGEIGETHFMATEFIDGQTLRRQMSAGRIELKHALEVAIQVATALSAAHAAGIVHRDIKPENIMVRKDGIVKVLDFGLAKLTEPEAGVADSDAPTSYGGLTEPGAVMGTLAYMSPEQARGVEVDARTDIFSLGAVIYEMLAARTPFQGETPSDVLAAILKTEPVALSRYLPDVPREVEHSISKALRKDREERYQGIKDLLIDLRDVKHDLELEARLERSHLSAAPIGPVNVGTATGSAQAGSTQSGTVRRPWWSGRGVKAALALGATAVLAALWFSLPRFGGTKETPASGHTAAFTQLTDQAGPELFPSLSPDGKSLVYARDGDIYSQRVGGKNPLNLTKDSPADDTHPAFSPDGERIAFRSERDGGGIFVMGATGEAVKRVTNFGFNPAWSPSGKEIVCALEGVRDPSGRIASPSQLWVVDVATGEKRLISKGDAVQPHWSPHGLRIAYWGTQKGGQRDILTIPAGGGNPVPVTDDAALDWNPVWSPDGKRIYFASDRAGTMNLWRVPVEETSGKVLGAPEPVTTPSAYSAHVSFSRDGRRFAYVQSVIRDNLQQVGFDPTTETVVGQPTWITRGSKLANYPDISPDGEWVVFNNQGEKQEDLFVVRNDGTGLRQLTDDPARDRHARWSPDGKRISFHSDRSGKYEIWTINPDGSGLQQVTYSGGAFYGVWSPDGTRLAAGPNHGSPFILDLNRPAKGQSPQILPPTSDPDKWFIAWWWSPDGRTLAGWLRGDGVYSAGLVLYSLESRRYEQLTDSGYSPVWLNDNRRLLANFDFNKICLVDSQSKRVHDVLSVAPNVIGGRFALSRDNRRIYFGVRTTEADIWLMALE